MRIEVVIYHRSYSPSRDNSALVSVGSFWGLTGTAGTIGESILRRPGPNCLKEANLVVVYPKPRIAESGLRLRVQFQIGFWEGHGIT